jgi:predicted dehydrogenase
MAGGATMRFPRRHFLFGSLAAAANLPARQSSAAKNDTVVLGFMGVRGRGRDRLKYFSKRSDIEIAYLADVDARLLPDRASKVAAMRGKTPKTVQDFRRVLDDKSVDALVIATPDHWHALGTIWACQAGKDVYVEKPTSHSIWESGKMVEAARKYNRVVQVGAQCRSAPYMAAALEYLQSGKLGEIHFVKVFNSKPRQSIGNLPDKPIPAGVDYDMWLGPAPMRPFNENRFHYAWHWFWDYSGGDIINDGVHQLDLARWCIGRALPNSVSATGGNHFFKDAQETPDTQVVCWDYDGLTMAFEQTLWTPYQQKTPVNLRDRDVLPNWPFSGTRVEIYGSKQWMMLGRHGDGWEVFDGEYKSVARHYGRQSNDEHVANFVDSVRSRKRPNGDIEELHYSTSLCHYGNIAYRVGRKLKIDHETGGFLGDDEANRLVKRTYRKPWVVPETV